MPPGDRAPRTFTLAQRALGVAMLLVALALLAGTLMLSWSMLEQTKDLGAKVKITDDIVDANVRTLSQVQRELLRLEVLIASEDASVQDLRVQSALVTQRVQEGTLSYQQQTLGAESLLSESRRLAARWRTSLRPLVMLSARDDSTAADARTRLSAGIEELERGYNQLVSDGEINRKSSAGSANADTKALLSRAHQLLTGLLVTFAAIFVFLVLGSVVYRGFHRQRERANRDLVRLNEELERHAHVVRATDNMVVLTDPAGLVEWVNPAFERTTGHLLADVCGRSPGSFLQGPATDPETVARMREHLATATPFREEIVNYAADGRAYWVSIDVNPLHDTRGALSGFVAVQTDVTERHEAEELLRRSKEAAEDTAREKSNFLASMSHEIRTPLNAVLGLTDLLLLTDLDSDQRDYVRTAHSSGRLLLALVNDILDFSALESGRIDAERRAFSLSSMLVDTTQMLHPETRGRDVELELDVAADVPDFVWGDETRLRQVLVNLLGNGLKFTERGDVRLEVRVVQSGPDGCRLRFAVHDSGIGIPADRLPQLFQPFTQGDASTTRRFGGTGLGLAICRLLMERMGGAIDVTSTVGEGSVFAAELVLDIATASDVKGDPDAENTTRLGRLRVLLAEDDLVNQMVATHMLRRLGIEPTVVGDGAAAVEAVLNGSFDVVLMDVHMPTLDGVGATQAIRAARGETGGPRILAITATALEGDRERLLAAGMDDYLSKPVQLTALARALSGALPDAARDLTGPAATPSGSSESSPVDTAGFAGRTGVEDEQFLVELVEAVVLQSRLLRERGIADADLDALRLQAHTLRGAAASASVPSVERAARTLEEAAGTGDPHGVRAGITALDRAVADVDAWLEPRRVRSGR